MMVEEYRLTLQHKVIIDGEQSINLEEPLVMTYEVAVGNKPLNGSAVIINHMMDKMRHELLTRYTE